MRKYLLLFSCGLAAHSAWAQHLLQVPSVVLLSFQKAQPQAGHVTWHRCPVGYEAAFEQQPAARLPGERRLRGLLSLAPTGEVLETRLDITYRSFPPLGHMAVSQQYPHRQLDRIIRIIDSRGGTSYEIKICQGNDKNGKDKNCQTSRFDENGRPLPSN